ncbi:hypothetical protein C8R43DRAFT_614347 [Mycena crocata]|nr:hypothetical protein C8R43DRAFT_614347 [Mycena crocata]
MHINAFPPEILVNIFEQGKSSPLLDIGGSTLLFAVSQVCAAWRALAHAYPMLWDDLRLSASSSTLKARNLLARYEGPTISVTLDARTTSAGRIAYWNLLNIIMAHAPRVRVMRFIGSAKSLRNFSRACSNHQFLQLQELVIVLFSEEADAMPSNFGVTINGPKLNSVSITGTCPLVRGNYTHLRHLHVESSGYFVHFDQRDGVLEQQILDLESLSITSSPFPLLQDPALFPMDSSITSLTLSRLTEPATSSRRLGLFLRLVRMPLLRHLEASFLEGYILAEFLKSLRPQDGARPRYPVLQSLKFESLTLAWMDDADAFHAVQSISKFYLVDVDPTPVMRLLEGNPQICPKLREIRLGEEDSVLVLPSRAQRIS